MKYEFKINGGVVDLETFYQHFILVGDSTEFEENIHEVLDTSSVEMNNTTFSIEVAS